MKNIKVILFAIIPLLVASCGINKYPFINEPVKTHINLSQNNYRIVKMVEGTASATYVLGIGGLSKTALAGNAIADMYKNAKLTGNQQIVDITTAYSTKFVFIYMKRLCTAQGYVIEFLQDKGESSSMKMVNDSLFDYKESTMPITTTEIPSHSANLNYIAWLLKSGKLDIIYREEIKHKFDLQKIELLLQTKTETQLLNDSKGHNVSLNKYQL